MADKVHLAVGIMGNAASLLLYGAPVLTFATIIRKKSTQEYSCVPYIVALLNCLIYTWYGLPIVSSGWENFPLITINGLGILLESSFIIIYLWFASTRGKVKVAAITIPIIAVFGITALISTFLLHNHHQRKVCVGSIGLVASVAMYSSPLVAVKQVIETKSVKYMPFYLSFFSFLASSIWMVYGILSHDLFLMSPSLVGCPLAMIQLVLYCKYRDREVPEETGKWDVEKNEGGTKQVELVTDVHVNT
ncbi:bidirectional sugar transporter SWEET3 [Silene latifolia]|uniref:bidirectional sugar transporter SWEET3 n=1 Tax=Silene latifolia TaxID=37657 RepID=UPI003D782F83